MRILITGASGFVGSAVLRKLLDQGHRMHALVRANGNYANLDGLQVQRIEGDLQDKASLTRALSGCQALYHVAADYRLWTRDPDVLYRTNVTGTRDLMLAAIEAGVERIVYTSSVATLGLNKDGRPANETTPVREEDMIGHYKRSKYLAEKEVQRLIKEHGLPAVIVNPSTPIGPRDIKPTPTGRMIVDAAAGRMPAYVDTGLNLVHVDDVAEGHLMAFEHGEIGQRYILGGHNMSLREILTQIAGLTGGKPPRVRLRQEWVMPLAHLAEAWAGWVDGPEPRMTVAGLRMSKKKMFFSCEKAQSELGYRFRPVAEALTEAIDWFSEKGYI